VGFLLNKSTRSVTYFVCFCYLSKPIRFLLRAHPPVEPATIVKTYARFHQPASQPNQRFANQSSQINGFNRPIFRG